MRQFPGRITTSRAVGLAVCGGLLAALIAAGTRAGRNGRTNVAGAKQGAVVVADSEFARYTADRATDGEWVGSEGRPEKNRWHSLRGKPHPHWIWIRFKQP